MFGSAAKADIWMQRYNDPADNSKDILLNVSN